MQSTLQHAFAHTYSVLSHQLEVSEATGDSHDCASFTASIDATFVRTRSHLGSQLALAGSQGLPVPTSSGVKPCACKKKKKKKSFT